MKRLAWALPLGLVLLGLVLCGPTPAQATCILYDGSDVLSDEPTGAIVQDTCTNTRATRTSLADLLSGEDQTNNLLMVSGGAARGTEGNIINSAVGDATSAAFTLPTGYKTLTGRITGAGAVAQVITVYGGTSSGMAAVTSDVVCTITLSGTSGAAGTAYSCPPFIAPFLYYKAVTSGSSGTPTTILTASY